MASVESRLTTERPKAPFITSTLQQEAARKLGFSAARAMHVAQGLYERGLITYMRTDSTTLATQAVNAARGADLADVRRRLPPAGTSDLPQQGEERAGGARGDPAGRRSDAHRRRRRARAARRRRAAALRPHLEADDRVPDGGRPHPARHGPPRRDRRPPAKPRRSRRPGARSSSPATCAPTSRAPTTPTPSSRTARRSCRRCRRATRLRATSCTRRVTRRNRRRATPRRAW